MLPIELIDCVGLGIYIKKTRDANSVDKCDFWVCVYMQRDSSTAANINASNIQIVLTI